MLKLSIIVILLACTFAAVHAKPLEIKEFFKNTWRKVKEFFKSTPMIQLRTITGLICNVTKLEDFKIDNIGVNLVVDVPVAILLKTINYISCRMVKTGEVVDRSVIEQEFSEHRNQVMKLRLVNPCDQETKVFEAEKYVDPSDETPMNNEWDENQRLDCPSNSNVRSIPSFVIIALLTATAFFINCL